MIAYAEAVFMGGFVVFLRVGSMLMIMPGFSSARVSARFRLFAAGAIAIALYPLVTSGQLGSLVNQSGSAMAQIIVGEILIGGSIGLLARIYMLSLDFILSAAAMSIGYGGMLGAAVEDVNPQASLGALISMGALMMLFASGFHHLLIRGLLNSYDLLPATGIPDVRVLLVRVTDTLSAAFTIALQLGSPFIAFALISNLLVGFLNKMATQLPVYFVSLPFLLSGGLMLIYFVLPGFLEAFVGRFAGLVE